MARRFTALLLTLSAAAMGGCEATASRSSCFQGQRMATFRAADILPAGMIRGSNYSIDDEVPVVDHMYGFTIRTRYGTIPAHGLCMLYLRLQELGAIERAARLAKDDHFVDGVLTSFEKTGEGLQLLLTDPGGALLDAPKGFGRMVKGTLDASEQRAGGEMRRKLAARLGCDPETRNPVLKKLLDEMSLQRKAGEFLSGAAVDVAGVGILKTTADIRQQIESQPLYRINEQIENELKQMGVSDYLCGRFCRDMNYTTMQRLIFMQHLRQLRGIEHVQALVEAAVDVRNEAEGLAGIDTVRILAALSRTHRIRAFAYEGLPVAAMADGTHIVIAPADYLTATREIIDGIADYLKRYPNAPTVILATGRVAPDARKAFEAAGARVFENGELGK